MDRAAAVARAGRLINRSWTGSPASNNVRELVATNVDILAINEGAIADVTVASPNVSVLVVWSNDNVTISGDSDDVVPIGLSVGKLLTFFGEVSGETTSDICAEISVAAEFCRLSVTPETHIFLQTGAPEVIMELASGRGMAHTDVQGLTFVLDSIYVATSEGIVDVSTSECDTGGSVKWLHASWRSHTTTTASIGRRSIALQHAAIITDYLVLEEVRHVGGSSSLKVTEKLISL